MAASTVLSPGFYGLERFGCSQSMLLFGVCLKTCITLKAASPWFGWFIWIEYIHADRWNTVGAFQDKEYRVSICYGRKFLGKGFEAPASSWSHWNISAVIPEWSQEVESSWLGEMPIRGSSRGHCHGLLLRLMMMLRRKHVECPSQLSSSLVSSCALTYVSVSFVKMS